nr:hypothetical protein GCM10025699_05310 [Microbacterium flavescens]
MVIRSATKMALATTAALLMGVSIVSPAAAAEPAPIVDLSDSDEVKVREFFDKFNVAEDTQDRLIAEFEAGGTWDAQSSTAKARKKSVREIDGVSWTVSTYADGSVRAEGIGEGPASAGGVTPFGVDGCGYKAGATGNFSSCHIYYWVGVVQLGFYANFTISKTGYDKITSAWSGTLFAGGACSQNVPEARVVKGTESSTGKAVAGLTAQATMCATSFTVNFPSYLHVGGNQATHVYS